MDAAPNCAICNAPADHCPCESERLQIAVKQAEQRAMEEKLVQTRDWVITHARQHILLHFERLTTRRKVAHSARLAQLPHYATYMHYSGHPPIHPMYIDALKHQIADAHSELKLGIDADWRASILRYPEVLDYFYSLVELRLPSDRSSRVVEPPFAVAGYDDRAYMEHSKLGKDKKKKRRESFGASADRTRYKEEQMHTVVGRVMRNPPPVPTPPIGGGYSHPPGMYPYT